MQLPPSAPKVTVNRTLPNVQPPSGELHFSVAPSDDEITQSHIFIEPLLPIGTTTPQDNQELARALTAFLKNSSNDDVSALKQFLDSHPQSSWRASLLTELGLIYRQTGWFSKALDCWEESWQLAKNQTDLKSKAIADRAVAELLELNGRLGRYDRLDALFAETKGRIFNGSVSEKLAGAREGLWLMRNRPEKAFRCGPMALDRIRALKRTGTGTEPLIFNSRSSVQGMSLSGVCDLANQLDMNFQMAKRQPGTQIIVPAVVHWKVGHYAALTRVENGKYLVQDPTFGNDIWVTPAALDAEASGYFLIAAGNLPTGWTAVNSKEGQTVWGKGNTGSKDITQTTKTAAQNPPCPPIGGPPMGEYNFMAMLVSLHVVDTPVGYTPARGPDMHFQVSYNQREAGQPPIGAFGYFNLGEKWTCNWLSYVIDYNGNPAAGVFFYPPNGGEITYTNYNSTLQSFPPDPDNHAILKQTGYAAYTRYMPDGSQQIFSVPYGPTNAANRLLLMSEMVDASGNAATFRYDSNVRLISVSDALGQVTTLAYGSTDIHSPLFYEITQITDPFGRSANLAYDSNYNLASITDIIGITSKFTYVLSDNNTLDFISSLTTPYGATTFSEGATGLNRWLLATDPMGQSQREEYDDSVDARNITDIGQVAPPTIQPGGVAVSSLNLRNTFFWDKEAMQLYPGDYTKAHIDHWLHSTDINVCSGVKESTKEPLEGRVWFTYPGQTYPDTYQLGTNNSPATAARILDDGSSQIYQYQYNNIGKVTSTTDPTNRVMIFTYATNNIDLLSEVQLAAGATNILGQFTYSTNHLPLTAVNAAGQTNFFAYNIYGQLTTLTNALNQTVTMSYDTNSYLTNTLGSLPGSTTSFTYDSYGRTRTISDSLGYTITTSYDAADRPTNMFYPDGTYKQIVYNYLDPVLTRDRNSHWTSMTYDPLRRLTDTYDNVGRHTQFAWCGCGSLESITDPMGNVTSWIRDLEGRVQTKVYPDTTQINYSYETNSSRLQSFVDAKSQQTLYSYFIDNNLKQVSYANALVTTSPVSYGYDTYYNRLLTMTDGVGTTTYSYYTVTNGQLGAGMLASVSNSFIGSSGVITYYYDALGRITNRAINGVAQQVTYDALGRVTMVTNALGSFVNTYVGTTAEISTNLYPNGQKAVFSYLSTTNDEQLQEIWNQNTTGATLSKFDYGYDPEGQITNWTQQADATTPTAYAYQYDAGKQLLSAVLKSTGAGATVLKQFAYNYDLTGNRTSEQIGTGTNGPVAVSQSSYNNMNQITNRAGGSGTMQFAGTVSKQATVTVGGNAAMVNHTTTNFTGYATVGLGTNVVPVIAADYNGNSTTNKYQLVVTNNGVAKAISYDLNGNETSVATVTGTNTYQWDAANRMVSVTGPTNQSLFTYDGYGRRVQTIELTNGMAYVTNKYVWDGQMLAEQRDLTGATVTKRFFGEGEQVSGTNYFFTRDHLGSVREVMNTAGVMLARYDYDPYGRLTVIAGSFMADFAYVGMYYHAASGLNLTLYRAYDSDLGRWLSRDPLAEQVGLNLYAYCGNNPINGFDPLGLWTWGGVALGIGVAALTIAVVAAAVAAAPEIAAVAATSLAVRVTVGAISGAIGGATTGYAANGSVGEAVLGGVAGGAVGAILGAIPLSPQLSSGAGALAANMALAGISSYLGQGIGNVAGGNYSPSAFGPSNINGQQAAAATLSGGLALATTGIFQAALPLSQDGLAQLLAAPWAGFSGSFGELFLALSEKYSQPQCFVAGTMVLTKDGFKPIQDIQIGDQVWSFDEGTGDKSVSIVQNKYINIADSTLLVYVENTVIEATATHPFWVESVGWKAAQDLEPGDRLQCFDGHIAVVKAVKIHTQKATVYNLEIQGFHTYFVSPIAVGVHNRCAN